MSAETALVVVVDEARAVVDPWRRRFAPAVVARGLPPHITILYPFVAADGVAEEVLAPLRELYRQFEPFSFDLVGVREFPGAVWLQPEPSAAFSALCLETWSRFPALPPYGGTVTEPVPHLTIAEDLDPALQPGVAETLRAELSPALPIRCRADAVTLLGQTESGLWRFRESLPLGVL